MHVYEEYNFSWYSSLTNRQQFPMGLHSDILYTGNNAITFKTFKVEPRVAGEWFCCKVLTFLTSSLRYYFTNRQQLFLSIIEMTSKCSILCSETTRAAISQKIACARKKKTNCVFSMICTFHRPKLSINQHAKKLLSYCKKDCRPWKNIVYLFLQ